MISNENLKKLVSKHKNCAIDDEIFLQQTLKLMETIFEEVDNFDVKKEYYYVYSRFRESIDPIYIMDFPNILDFTIRLLIHEIYISNDSTTNISINFDKINAASSANRNHFKVAKDIAEKTIKLYYFSESVSKNIINYIDEFLPNSYSKNSDINKVVWYFIVCVVSLNKQIVNNVD